MDLLVSTPKPHATESLLGFVLRTSDENGYETPWHVFDVAGITPDTMRTVGLDVVKLAAILGKDPEQLQHNAYSYESDGHSVVTLLGKTIRPRQLRLTRPQICPQCIVEKGFIEAHFDLTDFIACPDHGCSLLTTCPACDRPLTWFRPGLLECRCGHDLRKAVLPRVSEAVARLMAGLKTVALAEPADTPAAAECTGNTLSEYLRRIKLRSLLFIIDTLGRHALEVGREPSDRAPRQRVERAAEVLDDWPGGFFKLLRAILEKSSAVAPTSLGLRRRFARIYGALFKSRVVATQEVEFLRKAFIRFGLEEWGECYVDEKLFRNRLVPGERRFFSTTQLAANLGVRPITASRLIRTGKISAKSVTAGGVTRIIADMGDGRVLRRVPGKSYGERSAAAFLGIPVSVLQSLRKTGDYDARYYGRTAAAFHEDDLKSFAGKCLALVAEAPHYEETPSDLVALAQAMRLNFRSTEGKADVIREMLALRLPIAGRRGNSLGGILLHRVDVKHLLLDKRAATEGTTRSIAEVAARLHCDPDVVATFIKLGLLEGVKAKTRTRITESSIGLFEDAHVSLAGLAKNLDTSTCRLLRQCEQHGIPTEAYRRRGGAPSQPFISRDYVYAVLALPRRKTLAQARARSVTKLQQYLDSLRQSGQALPRRGQKPNKREIAEASDINRDVLYDNPEAVYMLNAFDESEQGIYGTSSTAVADTAAMAVTSPLLTNREQDCTSSVLR